MAEKKPSGRDGRAPQQTARDSCGVNPEHTWGHTTPFGDQYFEGSIEIFEAIKRTELPAIAELADRMAATLARGGNVWMQAKRGHMCRFEFEPANKGNPQLLRSNPEWDDSDYESMRAGDILVTSYVNENVVRAREGGVYVVQVTVCYEDNPSFPRGFVKPNALGIFQKDAADMMIDSHVPYEQGLVTCPEIPEMKIAPSSSNALTALFWMMQAETANRVWNASSKGSAKAEAVIDTLIERTKAAYQSQRALIFECAPTTAKAIGNKSHYYVTSDHGGVQCESTGVASGPMITNAFRREMKKRDVHLLTTIEPDSQIIVAEAKKARDMGMLVVSIAPAGAGDLRSLSDVWIDNFSPEGGGLIEIASGHERVGVAGGIMNNILMWIFTAQFVDEMVRRGWVPWFWMGYYRNGEEYNNAVKGLFRRQGF